MATARRRLGVALLIDEPVAAEIEGLRRALGDQSLERIAPHLTLVAPVNVRDEHLSAVLAELRSAAQGLAGPLCLRVGPPASFLPANPVLYLSVSGDLAGLGRLRLPLVTGSLSRPLTWDWVPHVTLVDGGHPGDISAATDLLAAYVRELEVDRVVLLEEGRGPAGRRWTALADAHLGPPIVVGVGGLGQEITRSRLIDPEAASVLQLPAGETRSPLVSHRPAIVLTARRQGQVAGAARAAVGDDGGHVEVLVRADLRRQGIGSHLLQHLEAAVADAGWACPVLHAEGPPGFYEARSAWARARTR